MSGSAEYGKCEICGVDTFIERTYFRYNIKCECHSPYHFELVRHCSNCVPIEPRITKIELNCNYLKSLSDAIKITERKEKLEKLNGQ